MSFDRAGFDREVGLRMQVARKSLKMTQEEVAKRIGLTRPSYASMESGRQRIPVDVVWRVAVVLGVSIASLVPEPLARRRSHGTVVSMHARRRVSNSVLPRHGSDHGVGFSPATNVVSAGSRAAVLEDDDVG